MYETRQMAISFPSHFNGYYCEEKKGSYGPQFLEAYSEASHINNSIPRKEKDPGRLDVGSVNIPYLLTRYLRRFAAGRKSRTHISGGQFVARLAEHFGLLTAKILGGLTVAMGPERHPDDAAGAPAVVEDAHAADEGDQAIPAPVQAPQQPPPPSATTRTMPRD
ncbi:hypothetical protein Tco_0167442 [Tanacetum coccineum]